MAIVILTSTCSSPGVTTLAVGLALVWPRSVLIADCDPGAHQSVLAGYLSGQSARGKGLLRVAEAHRDGRPLRETLVDQTIPLTLNALESRLFLPGFTKPGSASLFSGVWLDLAEAFDRLGETGMDVIIDAGRMGAQGLPPQLLEYAAVTCLVLQSNLRSVMSARVHVGGLLERAELTSRDGDTGLIVVGEGEPYDRREISKALGVRALSAVVYDRDSARHLSEGAPRSRKFDSSPLAKSLHTLASGLSSELQQRADRVAS